MEISKCKIFIYRNVLANEIYFAKDLNTLLSCIDEHNKSSLFGLIEIENGDTLFSIDFTYSGEPFVWDRFMHIKSFLGFFPYSKKLFLDKFSEQYIKLCKNCGV